MTSKKRHSASKPLKVSDTKVDTSSGSENKVVHGRGGDTIDTLAATSEPKTKAESSIDSVLVAAAAPASPAESKAGLAQVVYSEVRDAVARLFETNQDREFTVNAVIQELKAGDASISENSIRFSITELKRKSVIHHVRNQGHYQILKFSKPGEAKPFCKPIAVTKSVTKSALKGSSADIALDLTVLKDAALVVAKLEKLIHRNQEIVTQLQRLRTFL
jgi:hypothetical protein